MPAAVPRRRPATVGLVDDDDRGAIRHDLDHVVADLGRVEAHPDDRVRPELLCLGCHRRERFPANRGELVPVLVEGSAIPERVEPGHDVGAEAAPPHRDPEHEAERRHGAPAGEPLRRRDEHPRPFLASVLAAECTPTVAGRCGAHIVRAA